MSFVCDICGFEFPDDREREFDGQQLCPNCLNIHTLLCRECGQRFWRTDNAGTDELPLCPSCYEEHYTTCHRCHRLVRENEAYYGTTDAGERCTYCERCFHIVDQDTRIHEYNYKPAPVFHGAGPRFFGVELEIDEAGECTSSARTLLAIANRDGAHAYCKHDGSLEEGFEIVTHPMSLDYHLTQMPWAEVCRKAVSLGYLSHQAGTCGLHVHVSRAAFGDTPEKQDAVIARILYFFEKHWEELLKFSRRTPAQLDRWAARYGYQEQPKDILEHAKDDRHASRYTCVNLSNADTIEFRIFRGTLRVNTILATLQLLDRICDVALALSDDILKEMSWTTFAAGCEAPELVQYLKERRLYVNEPVADGEEI